MTVKKNLLLVLLIFIFLFSIQASFVVAQGCCLAPYDNGYDAYYLDVNVSASECYGSYRWVEDNCYELPASGQIISHVDDFSKGCCCNDATQTAASFGDVNFETQIFAPYCNSLNEGAGDHFTFQSTTATTCDCGASQPEESFFEVSGIVTRLEDNDPLSGIKIQLLDDSNNILMETTSADGLFSFTQLPTGASTFRAFTPPGHELICIAEEISLVLTASKDDLDFLLSCEENVAACEPNWYSGPWEECVPYTVNGITSLVRFRNVSDLNNCSTTIGQPTNVNTTSCEGEVSFGTCMNGILDGFEQCDYDEDSGASVFKDLYSDGQSNVPLTCGDFYFLEPEQPIGCTYTCTYDTSVCTPSCDDTCDRLSECGVCPSCDGRFDVCGNPCDQTKPVFLNEMEKSIRDVFVLYGEQESHPELYSSQNIQYFEGTKDVELSWSFNDSCLGNIFAFKVSICKEDSSSLNHCGTPPIELVTTDLMDRSLILRGVLSPETTYCYNVATISLNGANRNWAYNVTDDLPCFTTGSDYCMSPDHEQGFNCVSLNDDVEPAPFGCIDPHGRTNLTMIAGDCLGRNDGLVSDGNICVETDYDPAAGSYGARCRIKSNCTLCNGLFGLYANHNLKSFYFAVGSDDPINGFNCNGFLHTPGTSSPAQGLCYKDSTLTVDKFDSCDKITSCYDYNSELACGNDYCNKFTESEENSCEWSDYNSELGIGICKPKEESKEDCFKCDSESPLGFCDEAICGLYGNCYFKELATHGLKESDVFKNSKPDLVHDQEYSSAPYTSTCVHQRDMGCYFYDTQQDCEGSHGPVAIDVYYESDFGTIKKGLFGTNEQLVYSDDLYGYGDCFWNDDETSNYYGCNKNSDGFYDSPLQNGPYYLDDCEFSFLPPGFEQRFSSNPLNCRMDNESPQTNLTLREPIEQDQYISEFVETEGQYLPVYGTNEVGDIVYETNDSMFLSDEIATYFSFVSLINCTGCIPYSDMSANPSLSELQDCYSRNCEVYPQHTLESFRANPLKDSVLHHGEHLMLYYSEDSSHNLEVVNYQPIFIDAQGPTFEGEFNYTVKSFLLDQEDVYASNLSISFAVSEPAHCSGTLTLGTKEHPVGDIYSYDTEFSTFYPWLPDGYYNFNVLCLDGYQNELEEDFEIVVEGDKSITNPLPRGGVFTTVNNVRLSIEIPHEATCHLSSARQPFAVSPLSFLNENVPLDNGRFEHSVDYVDSQFNAADVSGTHVYFTSCDFGNGNITEMKNGDTLSFTIDKEAPETTIYASTTGSSYQSYDEASSEWSPIRYIKLFCSDDNTLTPVDNFGCKEIHYCIGNPIAGNQTFVESRDCLPINGARYMSVLDEDELELMDLREQPYSNKILYYYSVDKGGNTETLRRSNLRLRDVDFKPPMFEWVRANSQ